MGEMHDLCGVDEERGVLEWKARAEKRLPKQPWTRLRDDNADYSMFDSMNHRN